MRHLHALLMLLLFAMPSFAAKPAKQDKPEASGKLVIPPRITDIAAAGEAAYKARDAARVCEAYGQWVADREVPPDPRVYDRLALAVEKLRPVDSNADFYWKLSENSGQRTGRVVYKEWYRASRHPTDPDVALFKESLGFGEWFSAYMYSEMGRLMRYLHRPGSAGEYYRKAVAIEPTPFAFRELAELTAGGAKTRSKDTQPFVMRAAALAEARGQIDGKAYSEMRYDREDHLRSLAGMPLEEHFRRERWVSARPDPFEQAAWLYHRGEVQAFRDQVASMPKSAAVLYLLAMDHQQRRDLDDQKIDQLFADALAMDPAHAQSLIERVTTLRKLGRSAEAVASAEAGARVATPFLSFRAHQQLAWALLDANRFEDAYRQADVLLALRPGDGDALELRVRALAGMDKLEDALYWSAAWVATTESSDSHTMRGDLYARLGQHQRAAYNYLLAMKRDEAGVAACYPRWSAAIETYRAEHCATLPTNLLETLRANRLLVRPPGDGRPLHSPWGLVSKWENDGRLRLTDARGVGFVLAADGVSYSPIVDGELSREVLAPAELGDGRRQYPMSPRTIVWAPDASVYFGSVNAFVPSWKGNWFDCTGVSWQGPFLGYRPTMFVEVLAESTYKEIRDGREWVTKRTRLTGGLVDMVVNGYLGSQPTRFRSLDLGEHGTFHGTFFSDRTPRSGLLRRRDGDRAIVHETEVLELVPAGDSAWVEPGVQTASSYTLRPDDILEFRSDLNSVVNTLVRYYPDGRPPESSKEDLVWIHELPPPQPDEPENYGADSNPSDLSTSLGSTRAQRTCYRCKGTGMVWIAGGASQTSLSTPSYLSGSRAESWRNSSASIGTVYTSGHMGTCPVCQGAGGW